MDVTDLVKEEDDTLEFSYWREVSIWPQMMMLTFEVYLITNSAIISGGTAGAKGSFPNKKHGSNMSFFQRGGGGPGRTKSFEALFVCPEAIKSKQMPMCQKA